MTNLQNQNQWLWDKGKLMNRKFIMQDLYQKYLEGDEDILRLKPFLDPFWEPVEDLFVGTSNFFLQSLAYNMDFEDKSFITNYKGEEIGTIYTKLVPCTPDGKPLNESHYVDSPEKLLNKPFNFTVRLLILV
jgi:kinesin family protein 1